MRKVELMENFTLYIFEGDAELNIPLLIHENRGLLIDTGFPDVAKQLKKALNEDAIEPEIIINSHYHPDHINGNYHFKEYKFMGSEYYKQNFELFEALNPTLEFIKPEELIHDGDSLDYGDFHLQFFHLPGHCKDCLGILINDRFFFVADLLMFTNQGQDILPYIAFDGDIADHIQSLKAIESMEPEFLIPAHGKILKGSSEIQKAIERRIYYLEKLKDYGRSAKIQDCILGSMDDYHSLEYHKTNLKNIYDLR